MNIRQCFFTKQRKKQYLHICSLTFFLALLLSGCSFYQRVELSPAEQAVLKDESCNFPSLVLEDSQLFRRVAKRWQTRCPNLSIGFDGKGAGIKVLYDKTKDSDAAQNESRLIGREKEAVCVFEPLPSVFTLGLVPVTCTREVMLHLFITDNQGIGQPVELATVEKEYFGWIPLFTVGIPHGIDSMSMDPVEDRIIASIVSALKNNQ